MAQSVGQKLIGFGFPRPSAVELARQISTLIANRARLTSIGFPAPLARELAEQIAAAPVVPINARGRIIALGVGPHAAKFIVEAIADGGGGFSPDFFANSAAPGGGDGLTEATAFNAASALETAALAFGAGVKLGVARGSVFESAQMLLSSVANIRLESYGDPLERMPIFDGRLTYTGPWLTNVDRGDAFTNVYSVDVIQTYIEGYISVWRDGVKPAWLANRSLTTLQSTPNAFFIPNDGSSSNKTSPGTHTIHFHLPASGNPNTDGAEYKITDPTIAGAIVLGTNAHIKGIHTRCQMQADGSFTAGIGSISEDCLHSEGVKHEALMNSGDYRGTYGWHPYPDVRTTHIALEFFMPDGTGESIKWNSSAVRGPDNDYTQSLVAFGGHNSGAGTLYDSFEIVDCSAEDVTIVSDTAAELTGSEIRMYGRHADTLSGSEVLNGRKLNYDCRLHAERTRVVRAFTASAPHDVEGFRCFVKGRMGGVFSQTADWTMIRSCVVTDALTSLSFIADGESGGTLMEWSDTVIVYDEDNAVQALRIVSWTVVGDGVLGQRSNNVYYSNPATRILAIVDNITYSTPALFLAAFPEAGTVLTDPQVVDAEGGDFHTLGVTNGAGVERPDIVYTVVPTALELAAM